MNGRFQMQGGKSWILNANRFFWDSHWLEIWSNHLFLSMRLNGGTVAMDSDERLREFNFIPTITHTYEYILVLLHSLGTIILTYPFPLITNSTKTYSFRRDCLVKRGVNLLAVEKLNWKVSRCLWAATLAVVQHEWLMYII
jgi:hypothetical protein